MSYYPRYEVVDHFEDSLDAFYRNNKIIPLQTVSTNYNEDEVQRNIQHNINELHHYQGSRNFHENHQLNAQPILYNNTQQTVQQNNSQMFQVNNNSYLQGTNNHIVQHDNNNYYYENNQHNFQNKTYHNFQHIVQNSTLQDIPYLSQRNNVPIYNVNNISRDHVQYNGNFSTSQNQFNQSMVESDVQNELLYRHNREVNGGENIRNLYNNNFDRRFSTPVNDINQYNYVNNEFPSTEINQYNNMYRKVSTTEYAPTDFSHINEQSIPSEDIQNELENGQISYEEEEEVEDEYNDEMEEEFNDTNDEMEEEFNNITEQLSPLNNVKNGFNNVNGIEESIIRYETVEKNVNSYDNESFKVPYEYDVPYYNDTSVTGNYLSISKNNNFQNDDIIDECRNGIFESSCVYTLPEKNKVSQHISQHSKKQSIFDGTIDVINDSTNRKHLFSVESNVNKQCAIVNDFESEDEIFYDDTKMNANGNGHNNFKNGNMKSRKRQQMIIANNDSDKDSSSSECEQTNKKFKIDIKISHRLKSNLDSVSLKNIITSNGSEYTDYFCRWYNCDFITDDVEILFKHWGSCFLDDSKNSSSHISTRVSMENYFDHMYSHTHMKQFFCDKEKCKSSGFYTKSELEKHIRECYHAKNIHICRDSLCLITFTTGKARLAHENKIHVKTEPIIYHCPVYNCNKAFPDNSSLHRHIRLSHGNKAFELIHHLKHKSSNEKQTNKVLGLLTDRVTSHLNEEMFKHQLSNENENGCKNLLKFYDCLDVCVHKEYSSMKNILLKLISDIKFNKLKAPVNAFVKKYINNLKLKGRIIIVEETFVSQLSRIIFKNLKISDYPIIPSSVHEESQEREAEIKITRKYLFKKLENDEKIEETKNYSLKRTDDLDDTFIKMPDQLTEEDKCVEEKIFIEQEIVGFGQPINNINFDEHRLITISTCNNLISRRSHEKARNGINSPTLKNHETSEFCPGYLIRVLNDYKRYLNSSKGKNFLAYKNKLPLHTKTPEEYNDDTKKKKTAEKTRGKNNNTIREPIRRDNKERTTIIMDDTDTEEIND
ncbi:Transcriptional activator cubitus interruptus [Strongyloides ratti]|uniref:Transcriptional activator cubitus interruptus n=1 Tax=Strongyloides ratti TaxID=34506 RepID=A0A090KQV9_STRRB|nr:Transcriptional activator cubitus interruptus [Strongyloides ratti]CEF59744.1 Transcriptional activator cubitus interruptus [Strongyloides ratti]